MDVEQLKIGAQVNDIFNAEYYLSSCYCFNQKKMTIVIYDGHQYIIEYDIIQNKEISRFDFSKFSGKKIIIHIFEIDKYNLYFILTINQKIYILQKQTFNYIYSFTELDTKFMINMTFCEQNDSILLITREKITQIYLQIETNVHIIKYFSSQFFNMEIIDIIDFKDGLECNKGFKIYKSIDMFLVWNNSDLNIYNFSKIQLQSQLKGLGDNTNQLLQAIYNQQFNYLITGHTYGELKIWMIQNNQKNQIFIFNAHNKGIQSLQNHELQNKIIISASTDQTIKYWNIDQFSLIISHKFPSYFTNIQIINSYYLFGHYDKISWQQIQQQFLSLMLINLNKLNFIYDHASEIIQIQKQQFQIYDEKYQIQNLQTLQISIKNNSGMNIDCQKLNKIEDQNQIISFIHTPPKSSSIMGIYASPYEENIYFMHTYEDRISKLISKQNINKQNKINIDSIIFCKDIVDFRGFKIQNKISIFSFTTLLPTFMYDFQDEEQIKYNQNHLFPFLENNEQQTYIEQLLIIKPFCLGTSQGEILFLSQLNMKKFIIRLHYHDSEITFIDHLYKKQQNIILSVCKRNILNMTIFKQNKTQNIKQIDLQFQFGVIKCFQKNLFINTKNNFEIYFFKLKQSNQVIVINQDICASHENQIKLLDIWKERKILVSYGLDFMIKFFNLKKNLLFQISFDDNLQGMSLINLSNDILISQDGKLYTLKNIYFIKKINQAEQQINLLNQKHNKNEQKYKKIEEFFQISKQNKDDIIKENINIQSKMISYKNQNINESHNDNSQIISRVNRNKNYSELKYSNELQNQNGRYSLSIDNCTKNQYYNEKQNGRQSGSIDNCKKNLSSNINLPELNNIQHSIDNTQSKTNRQQNINLPELIYRCKQSKQIIGIDVSIDIKTIQNSLNESPSILSPNIQNQQNNFILKKKKQEHRISIKAIPTIQNNQKLSIQDKLLEKFARERIFSNKKVSRYQATQNKIIMRNLLKDSSYNKFEEY